MASSFSPWYRLLRPKKFMNRRGSPSRLRALLCKRGPVLIAALLGSFGLPRPSEAGLDFWTPTGPPGGTVRSISIARTNPSVIYAGLELHSSYGPPSVWKSVDGGRDWFRQSLGVSDYESEGGVAISPVDENTAYAVSANHLLKTTDGGVTWSVSSTLPFPFGPLGVTIDPSSSSRVYVCGVTGVVRSTDGGETWTRGTGLGSGDVYVVAVDPRDSSLLFAAAEYGVFVSTDGGATWSASGAGIPDKTGVEAIAIDPRDRAVVFAATETGVYRSADRGKTWASSSLGMGDLWVHAVAIDPAASNHVLAGTDENGLFESFDGGASWSQVPAVCSSTIFAITPDPAVRPVRQRRTFVGGSGGMWLTADGGATWTRETRGLSYADATAVLADPANSSRVLAAIYGEGIAESDDRGETWALACGSFANTNLLSLVADPRSPSTLWAGTDAGIYRSVDSGRSWTFEGLTDLGVTSIAIDPSHSSVIYAGTFTLGAGELFKSVDGGLTWQESDTELKQDAVPNSIAIDPTNTQTVYVAMGSAGNDFGGLYQSSDAGSSWKLTSLGHEAVTAMALDLANPNTIYAATADEQFFVSSDRAASWQRVFSLGDVVTAIAIDPADDQRVYFGTFGYIWRTTDGWKTHVLYDLRGPTVYCLAFDGQAPGRVYAGVSDQGVLSFDMADPYPLPGSLLANGTSIVAAEGIPFTVVVANFIDGDANKYAPNFQVTIDWGDGTTGAGIVSGYTTGPTVLGSHTYADDGTFAVKVTIHDIADDKDAVASTTAVVANADVLVGRPATVGATPGVPFSGIVATFTDANGAKAPSGFAATIDWGDGTVAAGTVAGASGSFTVTGSHTYLTPAVFGITVTIGETDQGAAPISVRSTAIVSPPARQTPRSRR
jgi:photosystem II stability/assembly factor-like uncharacterized protein